MKGTGILAKHTVDFSKPHLTAKEKVCALKEVEVLKMKYPSHIPVYIKTHPNSRVVLKKHKYLVSEDLTVGQFLHVVRRQLQDNMNHDDALYLLVNNTIPPTSQLLSALHGMYAEKATGMLCFTICKENTFGTRSI